jgi:hypothetical protein
VTELLRRRETTRWADRRPRPITSIISPIGWAILIWTVWQR